MLDLEVDATIDVPRELVRHEARRPEFVDLSVPGYLPEYGRLDEWALWIEVWVRALRDAEMAKDRDVDVKLQHAQCSMAKLYASEMAGRVADRAVQIFGGRGYMRENVAERFHRELRVDRIWEGTSEIQRNIVADQLAKRGVRTLAG